MDGWDFFSTTIRVYHYDPSVSNSVLFREFFFFYRFRVYFSLRAFFKSFLFFLCVIYPFAIFSVLSESNAWRTSCFGTIQERYMLFWTNPGNGMQGNSSCTATYLSSHKPFKTNKFWALLVKQGCTQRWGSLINSPIETQLCGDQQRLIYIHSVQHRMQFRGPVRSDRQ